MSRSPLLLISPFRSTSPDGYFRGVTLTFLAALGVFTAPALLGGVGIPVFATTIADLFGASSGRWPMGAAFGFILLLSGSAIAGLLALVLRRIAPEHA